MSIDSALAAVNTERVAALALDLVAIPSPTGDTVAVTDRFTQELRDLGMEVETHRDYPATPVVVGRLRGASGGRTLVLNGHLDTVPIPHAPAERRDGRLYGRGSIDMKGPLAAAAEAIRATRDADLRLSGDVVLCAHGLHEAPGGHAEDLEAVLRRGDIRGDAAIVLEVGHDALPVAGMGSAIYQIHFRRPEGVTHELRTPSGTPHPALAAAEAALSLRDYNERLSRVPIEGIGPESLFIGQLHCGDFFNRFPNHAWLEGTRRYAPENRVEAVTEEMRELLRPIGERYGLLLEVELVKVRDGFRISVTHPVVEALQEACTAELGHRLPITGIRVVADAPLFDKVGGIPCLYHGLQGEGAHGDVESLAEAELARGARTYLRTMVNYLGVA